MKRIITIILFAVFILLTFSYCKVKPGNSALDTTPNDNVQQNEDINCLWAPGKETSIVVADDYDNDSVMFIYEHIYSVSGVFADIGNESVASKDSRELIIGKSIAEASILAYEKLEEILDSAGNDNCSAFVIYGLNNSVAVAYTDSYVQDDAAIALTTLFDDEVAEVKKGVLYYECEKTVDYIAEKRNEILSENFDKLEEKLPKETVTALRNLYSAYYNEDLYIWIANLYDPETGAFYYSNSARNTESFLPDLESTSQALGYIMIRSGLLADYDNDYTNAFSEEMLEKLKNFVLDMQSSEDGFFYHPQWETDITLSRRGRDLKWASQILKALDVSPYYDTPDGMKGSIGAPGSNVSAVSLTQSLKRSVVSAVSAVIPVSATPTHMKSEEAFKTYLDKLDFAHKSYSVGNELNAQALQIKAAGLSEFFISYVNNIQNPENGTWEEEVSYAAINGLFKIGETVESLGGTINYIDKAFDSAIKMALTPELTESDNHVCSIYNMWEVMVFLIDFAEKLYGENAADEMRDVVLENSVELINITIKKMSAFYRDHGGFSFTPSGSAPESQGSPVAVEGSLEADVNASAILSTGTLYDIYAALGVDFVPMYYSEDGEYFLNLLENMQETIKDPEPPFDGVTERVATFTKGQYDTKYLTNYYYNQINEPTVVGDYYEDDLKSGFDPITNYFVTEDPTNVKNKVLKVVCEKSKDYSPGTTKLVPSNEDPKGSCYALQCDLYYTDILDNGDVTQIFFQNKKSAILVALRLVYNKSAGTLKIAEYNDDGSGTATVGRIALPTNEWFTLRIEYYQTKVAETSMMKIFLGTSGENLKCVAEFNCYREAALNNNITKLSIAHQRTNESTLYMDNVSFTRTAEVFETEFVPDLENIPCPNDMPADFENGFINSGNMVSYKDADKGSDMIGNSVASHSGTEIGFEVTSDPTYAANKVLKVTTTKKRTVTAGWSEVLTKTESETGNAYVFDTMVYYDKPSGNGDVVYYIFRDSAGKPVARFRMLVHNLTGDVRILDYNSTSQNNGAEIARYKGNTWLHLRIEFYQSSSAEENYVKIYMSEKGKRLELLYVGNAVQTVSDKPIANLRMEHQRTNASTVYYDEVSMTRIDKAFSFETDYPVVPTVTDFSNGSINGDNLKNYDSDGQNFIEIADNGAGDGVRVDYSYVESFEGRDDVLKATAIKTDGAKNAYTVITPDNVNPMGNTYIFEGMIYVEPTTFGKELYYMYVRDSVTRSIWYLYFTVKADGYVYISDQSALTGAESNIAKFESGKWTHLKMEFYRSDVQANNYIKIFIDGDLAVEKNALYTMSSDAIADIKFDYVRKYDNTVYYDDMSFIKTDKEFESGRSESK